MDSVKQEGIGWKSAVFKRAFERGEREHNQDSCRNPRSQSGSRTLEKEIRRERKVRRMRSGDGHRRG